jgi:prevent-host-death family protein
MWLRNHILRIDMVTTLSGRELNQDLGRAKRAAKDGPVIITDRGRPAHVLMSFDEYKRLTGKTRSLGDMLAAPEAGDLDLPLPPRTEHAQPVDLS